MKMNSRTLIAGLFLALIPGMASALNIGVVRADDLVQQSPQYKAAEERMRADFERRAASLQEEATKLEEDINKFRQEADIMAPGDRERRQQELGTRQNDFQLKQRQFREDVANRERELFEDMMGKIRGVVERVARQRDIDVIITDAIYAVPHLDLTEIILRELNKDK